MVVVTKLDTKYSPKFQGYRLKDGKIGELKIHKKKNPKVRSIKNAFLDTPLKDGDIILIKSWKEEPRKRKTADGTWENVEGVTDWWVNEYKLMNTI